MRRFFSAYASTLMLVVGCTLVPVEAIAKSKRVSKDDVIILFGNIGYTDADTQEALFGLLTDETFAIEDASDSYMAQVSTEKRNGFKKLSAYPVAVHLEQLESAIAQKLDLETAPFNGTEKLAQHFSKVLGILLVGSYEDHKSFSYPYTLNGERRRSHHDYFVTSVSALLVDLQSDEILLSTTAFGIAEQTAAAQPVSAQKDIQRHFLSAYKDASVTALHRLSTLARKRGSQSLRPDIDRHMVTGAWVNGERSRALFGWHNPGPSPDMCNVPSGCGQGGLECSRLVGLMVHGFTDALSEAGFNTLPPLGWSDWRGDNAMHFSRRFLISENRKSLIDRLIDISVDPRDAATKYVPALDDVGRSSVQYRKKFEVVDQYTANLSLISAQTGAGQCTAKSGINVEDDPSFHRFVVSERPLNSDPHGEAGQRLFYSLALLKALPTLVGRK